MAFAFALGVGLAFGFEAGDAFPAALGGADFGFADFFDLELAIGLDIEQTVWPHRPRKSLATKDGRDRMARREGQIHRGAEAQAEPAAADPLDDFRRGDGGIVGVVVDREVGLLVVGFALREAAT